ncbi:MAG: hypothetical protein QME64_02845 [bacterium]|nr:hypothetical protein [bacterium]
MGNKDSQQNKNIDTSSRPRSGFSATAFIKKQLERSKPPDGTKPASEVVSFPITSELQALLSKDNEIKPEMAWSEIMNHYLAAAQEHLAAGAVWEAVGVYRAVLKLAPENLAVRQQLVDILLKNHANPDAVKELIAIAALYQKQENAAAVQQIYQKILVLDPENQVAQSAIGISEEEVVVSEVVPSVQEEILPAKEPELVSVSAPESLIEPIAEEKPAEPEISGAPESPATAPVTEEVAPVISEPQSLPRFIGAEPIPESTNGKLEYYRKKLEQDAKNIEARRGYINAYLEIGLEFDLVPEYLALAEAELEKDEFDTAEKTYRHILSLEPDNPGATQGLVKVNQNRPAHTPAPRFIGVTEESKEAKLIENYRRILQLNPLNSEIAHRLAAIFQERNQPETAVTELQQLADAYMQRTMYTRAIKVYNEALAIAPKNQEVQMKLEKAQELQQSMTAIESAIKSYKSGLDYGPIKRSS